MKKNDIPVHVSDIDFTSSGGKPPHDPPAPNPFSDDAIDLMDEYNGYNKGPYIEISGIYMGEHDDYKGHRYTYLANRRSNGTADIQGDKKVCLPCPDFCQGNIDTSDQLKKK